MARNNHITNAFIAGEASPRFYGRTETGQYNQACKELLNAVVYPQGGAARRAGTVMGKVITKADMTTTPAKVRYLPFVASDGTRWVIVMTDAKPDAPAAYNPASSTNVLEWHAYEIGSGIVSTRTNVFYQVETTFGTADNALKNYYDFSNYDFHKFQYAQAGDTLVVTSGIKKPFIFRYDPTGFNHRFVMTQYPNPVPAALVSPPVDMWKSIPYDTVITLDNSQAIDFKVSGGGNITLERPAGGTITFDSTWLGRYVKFERSNVAVVVMVTFVASGTQVQAIRIAGTAPANSTTTLHGGATAVNIYYTPQWDDNKGWPVAVSFYDSRLVFGGNKKFPDRMWFSQISDIFEITFPDLLVQDVGYADPQVTSDAFQAELKQQLLSDIRWMNPGRTLVVGTGSREFIVSAPDQAKSIGIDNFKSDAETPHGSLAIQAVRVENTIVFLQRDGRKLREMVFNEPEDSYKAANLSIIGEHMHLKSSKRLPNEEFRSTFVAMVQQEIPLGILWLLDQYGALAAITREREQNVAAWHYHYLGGQGKVKTLVTLPQKATYFDGTTDVENDLLVLGVERQVFDGAIDQRKIYLEIMRPAWENPTLAPEDQIQGFHRPVYMDLCYEFDKAEGVFLGNDPGVISGLDVIHGVGAIVDVVCNNIYLGTREVSIAGEIDISDDIDLTEDWDAQIGFSYLHRIVPVPPEVPATTGSSQGLARRTEEVNIHFYRTCSAYVGRDRHQEDESTPLNPPERVEFPAEGTGLVPMFTGMRKILLSGGYEQRESITIESSEPLPCEVTHIISRMAVYE